MSFDFKLDRDDVKKFSVARVRDAAFDAVYSLWMKRKAEGVTQHDIAKILDRDPSWVSRSLAGPSNWTLRTFGELTEALNGHAFITVEPEEAITLGNYDIYADIEECTSELEPLTAVVARGVSGGIVNVKLTDPGVVGGVIVAEPKAKAYAG